MSRTRLAAALVLALGVCLATTAHADDPYADYRIPDHHWFSWTASAAGNASHLRTQTLFSGLGNSGGSLAFAGTSLSSGFDSDPLQLSFGITPAFSGSRGYSAHEFVIGPVELHDIQRTRQAREDISSFVSLRSYPWAVPVGLQLGSSQRLSLQQFWGSSDRTTIQPGVRALNSNGNTQGAYALLTGVSASVGLGRVRDATPVYQAQVLESRLRSLGTLERGLSATAREKLIALYTVEGRLAFAHDRPTKYFWRELERVLREDGALGSEGLDAFSVQRLLEPLTIRSAYPRARGWFIGPEVALNTNRIHTSEGASVSSAVFQADTLFFATQNRPPRHRSNFRDDVIATGVGAEYHRPLGMRLQADGGMTAFLSESGADMISNASFVLAWLVSDRWLATTGFAHALEAPGHGLERTPREWNFDTIARASYFLEDSWTFDLSGQLSQRHDPNGYSRRESISLGVTRRFSGRFAAPGLVEPMRLSPPTD